MLQVFAKDNPAALQFAMLNEREGLLIPPGFFFHEFIGGTKDFIGIRKPVLFKPHQAAMEQTNKFLMSLNVASDALQGCIDNLNSV